MRIHDITKNFNGSITKAAYATKIRLAIAVSSTGLILNPKPVLEFAKIISASSYIFDNNCGHLAPGCEMETFEKMVHDFFDD